jgi:hypothetical protein
MAADNRCGSQLLELRAWMAHRASVRVTMPEATHVRAYANGAASSALVLEQVLSIVLSLG